MTEHAAAVAATAALCPRCAGSGAEPGSFMLHDFDPCRDCGGSGLARDVIPPSARLHPPTARLIDEFCAALKRKALTSPVAILLLARSADPEWPNHLRSELRRHIDNGDPQEAALLCLIACASGISTANSLSAPGEGWTIENYKQPL